MSAVTYEFRATRAGAGAPKRIVAGRAMAVVSVERVPRIARLLALAHRFQGLLDRGEVESMADLARLGRVTRARVTQIMDLLLLAPDIQEEILFLPAAQSGRDAITLKEMRDVCGAVAWEEQRARWALICSGSASLPAARRSVGRAVFGAPRAVESILNSSP